jgi:murein DD-endopeptidase MepM/ murein hydrolase activator NlpD
MTQALSSRWLQVAGALQQRGFTPEQAAGIVGNFKREAGPGLDPRINEGGAVGAPRGQGGYGLAQWTGSRQNDLIRFAGGPQKAGDLNVQLDFLMHELKGPEKRAYDSLRRARTPQEAATAFERDYERAGVKAVGERQRNAQVVYDLLKTGSAPQGGSLATTPAPSPLLAAAETPAAAAQEVNDGGIAAMLAATAPKGTTRAQRMAGETLGDVVASMYAPAATQAPPAATAAAPMATIASAQGGQSTPAKAYSFEKPSSVTYESKGGQPGVDLFFESKRFPAVLGGVVKDIGRQGNQQAGYGNYVVVASKDPSTGKDVDVLYGHLADNGVHVKVGQSLAPGQPIGIQGGTGSVRSADGTIASVDFLAPAPQGSGSMTPYSNYDALRRLVVSQMMGQ